MYATKTCICAGMYVSVCRCVLMFVYVCVDRESGWLLPAAWHSYTGGWRHHHHSAGTSLRYIPRRAVLYCPGNDERKLRKLASLHVDCAVLDCEDGVALSKKVCRYILCVWNTEMHVWMKCSSVWTGQQGTHKHTSTAAWSWMIWILSASFRQVLGLNHWKENYLSEMFKTSTFHPIMMV